LGPGALAAILGQLPKQTDPRILVGTETSDDAGVFLLNETTALVQTLDFFTPIVNDPYMFGQIAAANSLSDIYAMGGTPLTAMNIVTFPFGVLDDSILSSILRGGFDKTAESGTAMLGGHTIEDAEPKYGLSVTGIVHPSRIRANVGAQVGDLLILTKPLGTGVLFTASQADLFAEGVEASIVSMALLNRSAAERMSKYNVHACTDITGFGFLGHLSEMTTASSVCAEIQSNSVPLFPDAREAARMGLIPAGAYSNRDYLKHVVFDPKVPEEIRDLLFDPQTSGGLLICLSAIEAEALAAELEQKDGLVAKIIGRVTEQGKGELYVI